LHDTDIFLINLRIPSSSKSDLIFLGIQQRFHLFNQFTIPHKYFVLRSKNDRSYCFFHSSNMCRITKNSCSSCCKFEFLYDIFCYVIDNSFFFWDKFRSFESIRMYIFSEIITFCTYCLDTIHHLPDKIEHKYKLLRSSSTDRRILTIKILSSRSRCFLRLLSFAIRKTSHTNEQQSYDTIQKRFFFHEDKYSLRSKI